MNTLEIDAILRDHKRIAKTFKGVNASDELPARTSTDSLFVCIMIITIILMVIIKIIIIIINDNNNNNNINMKITITICLNI